MITVILVLIAIAMLLAIAGAINNEMPIKFIGMALAVYFLAKLLSMAIIQH